jgi:hypothetical protein
VQFLAIVALCVLSAIAYGILHDQVTARICVEYFTIGHPPIFGTDDPTLLGLGWGVIATWWVGVLLGIPLACAARLGRAPKRTARSLLWPLIVLMTISAVCAAVAGLTGATLARAGVVWLIAPLAHTVPQERHAAFLTDLWAHNASYASGFIGGAVLIWRVWSRRGAEIPVCRN